MHDLSILLEESSIRSRARIVSRQLHGRLTLSREILSNKPCYIHLVYVNCAFEWIRLHELFMDCLIALHLDKYLTKINDIVFSWSYRPSVCYNTYQPCSVFCNLNTSNLQLNHHPCICQSRRFQNFVDPQTLTEKHLLDPICHIRTTDLAIVQSKSLQENLQKDSTISLSKPLGLTRLLVRLMVHGNSWAIDLVFLRNSSSKALYGYTTMRVYNYKAEVGVIKVIDSPGLLAFL